MFAGDHQNATQVDEFFAIQAKRINRGSSSGRSSNYVKQIIALSEVLRPFLTAGIEKWNETAGLWVVRVGQVFFEVVASAGKSEIFKYGSPAFAEWGDVIEHK